MYTHKKFESFSGTDALVFMLLPEATPISLGSITTISYSIYRDTKPVALMDRISVAGYTRGTRFCAGTMIFTLVNKHWVNELLDNVPWLKEYGELKADELPIFDLMVVCANEYGAWTRMVVHGVSMSDEGQVLSIEDIFTENQFSFVARDIQTMNDDKDLYTIKATTAQVTANSGASINSKATNNTSSNAKTTTITSSGIKTVTAPKPSTTVKKPTTSTSVKKPSDVKTNNVRVLQHMNPTMTGEDVKECQALLNKHNITITVDGRFGPLTETAVSKFQSKHNIKATGIVDSATWTALRKSPCTYCSKSTTQTRVLKLISPTMKGNDVKEAQTLLSSAGYSLKIDSSYGPKTESIVKAYQESRGLTINGQVDSATWSALRDNKGAVPQPQYPTLSRGAKGEMVKKIQNLLNKKIGAKLTIDGSFGEKTYNAVRAFQKANGIEDNGIVGSTTWTKLLK